MEASLEAILEGVGAPDGVLTILKKLNCGRADLFAVAVKESEDVDKLLKGSTYEGNVGVEAQTRLALMEARTLLQRNLKRRAEGLSDEHLDSPLDSGVQDEMVSKACVFYSWKRVDVHKICNNRLIGRFRREFIAFAHSLFPIRKVATAAEAQSSSEPKRSRLADRITVIVDGQEENDGSEKGIDLLTWLDLFETLTITWAVCGCYEIDWKDRDERVVKIKMAHQSDLDQYRREFVTEALILRKTFTDASVVLYLDTIELSFRSHACELGKPPLKMPWGLALLKAQEVKAANWSKRDNLLVARQRKNDGRQPPPPSTPTWPPAHLPAFAALANEPYNQPNVPASPRKPRGGKNKAKETTKDGKVPCFLYNGAGCKRPQCRFAHVCNVVLKEGGLCGAKHPASSHDEKQHGKKRS